MVVRSLTILGLGLIVGAGGFWGISALLRDDRPAREDSASPAGVKMRLANLSPNTSEGLASDDRDRANVGLGPGPVLSTDDPSGTGNTVAAVPAVKPRDADAPTPTDPPPTSVLEEERQLAIGTFDRVDRERGRRLLEEVYARWKDSDEINLSEEVRRLIEVETRFSRRVDYARYLATRDLASNPNRLFDTLLAKAIRQVAGARGRRLESLTAWETLTLAYECAQSRLEREKVLAHIEPFLRTALFDSPRPPLTDNYIVKFGDSLFKIASRHKTTVDALMRLNGLSDGKIQPRHRLRILTGRVRVFVDKSDFRLWATVDDRLLLSRAVGLGRDNATPEGTFVIRVRQKNPAWWQPGKSPIQPGDPRNILGTRWLGFEQTQEYSGYGIHGTADETTIGKESSAGCIRLRNSDVELLYDFLPYGTEVVVRD